MRPSRDGGAQSTNPHFFSPELLFSSFFFLFFSPVRGRERERERKIENLAIRGSSSDTRGSSARARSLTQIYRCIPVAALHTRNNRPSRCHWLLLFFFLCLHLRCPRLLLFLFLSDSFSFFFLCSSSAARSVVSITRAYSRTCKVLYIARERAYATSGVSRV